MRVQPSQLFGRATYTTPKGGGNQVSPLATPVFPQSVPYYELFARISHNSGLLAYLSAVFHPTTPIGLYLLLMDQINSPGEQDQANLLTNGDPALVTLGPTMQLGSMIVFSHADCEAPIYLEVQGSDSPGRPLQRREMRGFPFDAGCVAVLSSTPGTLTQLPLINGVAQAGARFTARWQSCG